MDVKNTDQKKTWQKYSRLIILLTVFGIMATLAVIPYVFSIQSDLIQRMNLPAWFVVLALSLQSGLFVFFCSWLGLKFGMPLGLDAPFLKAFVYGLAMPRISKRVVFAAVLMGIMIALFIVVLDRKIFMPLVPADMADKITGFGVERWQGFLASFYGGIVEEVLLRFAVMTMLVWSLWKTIFRKKDRPAAWVYWAGNIAAAFLFGIGHLPALAGAGSLTTMLVVRTVALNAMAGVVFGYFYWKKGLEHAMLSHFCADIVLHVIFLI